MKRELRGHRAPMLTPTRRRHFWRHHRRHDHSARGKAPVLGVPAPDRSSRASSAGHDQPSTPGPKGLLRSTPNPISSRSSARACSTIWWPVARTAPRCWPRTRSAHIDLLGDLAPGQSEAHAAPAWAPGGGYSVPAPEPLGPSAGGTGVQDPDVGPGAAGPAGTLARSRPVGHSPEVAYVLGVLAHGWSFSRRKLPLT